MSAVFVPGRPAWSRDEPLEVQAVIVKHKLTQPLLRVLRDFALGDLTHGRIIAHSSARALRERGFGDISSKLTGAASRQYPRAEFFLSETGKAIVRAVADSGFVTETVSPDLTRVTITQPGGYVMTNERETTEAARRSQARRGRGPYRDEDR